MELKNLGELEEQTTRYQVNRRHKDPPNSKRVCRPSRWGNPFKMKTEKDRPIVIRKYRVWLAGKLHEDPDFIEGLRGKRLGCYCSMEQRCHADVILEFLRKTSKRALIAKLHDDKRTKLVVEKLGDNIGDVTDVLTILHDGFSRDRVIDCLEDPSVKPWLGRHVKGINSIIDLRQLAVATLGFDNQKEDIKELLIRRFRDFRAKKLGPSPSREERQKFLKQLEASTFHLNIH